MAERLTFTLTGRDELSRVLNGTADSADHLRLRMAGLTAAADGSLRDLHGNLVSVADAQRRLAVRTSDLGDTFRTLRDETGRLGSALKANLISLAPAAIPAAAGLAGSAAALAAQFGAVAVSAGAYALALGPQISAIGEATEAQDKYEEAVEASGAASQDAAKAQADYQRQLAKLPPETRKAAVAVGILKDTFEEWSDDLSDDVMGPFNKGIAVTNTLLPKTSGLVVASSSQFDRLITMVGGAIETPGFDRMNRRLTDFTERTLDHGIDRLTVFLAKLESGEFDGGGLAEFMDYARTNGPVVWETLQNVGAALVHVLEAGSEVGVGMLQVINVLSDLVTAVPPEAIATLLQLAIAVKAVRLAAAGAAAGQAAVAALSAQIAAMSLAARAAPGRLAAVTAAIGALSRGAKLAMAGTGIGLLVIGLTELANLGQDAPPDIDRLTTSLGEFGRTGKLAGEAAQVMGEDLGELQDILGKVADPSVSESIANWGADITGGILRAGDSTEALIEHMDGIDEALTNLVQGGNAELAAAVIQRVQDTVSPEEFKEFREELDNYDAAMAGVRLETELTAESMGMFGAQAQEVQGQLDAQRQSADGLRESIQALNDVNRSALGGQIAFEAAIDATAKAALENAGVLDMQGGKLVTNTEKQRNAASALNDLAAKTDAATAAARDSGASWAEVSDTYERGRQQLIKNAIQMGLNKDQAKALADQILKTPDKTAFLKGDVTDLEAKLADAKKRLDAAPDEKKTHIRGEISDLKRKIRQARNALATVTDKTVTITTRRVTEVVSSGVSAVGRALQFAQGGQILGFPGGGLLHGPGTATSDSIPIWASNGEYIVKAAAVAKYGARFLDAINSEQLPIGRAARPGLPAAAASAPVAVGGDEPRVTYIVNARKSVIDVEDLRLIQRQEEARQRVGRPG